jgi:molybdenum cofactor cytidylyltransferase
MTFGSPPVEAIILAAGRSSRMGSNKLAADLDGKPVVAHVADAIEAAGLPPPIVVLGHDAAAVRDALRDRHVRFVEVPDYAEGLSRSLRRGVQAVSDEALAAIICLGDMPFIPPEMLRAMASDAHEGSIVVPRLAGNPGNPILWGRAWFPRLTTLSGDTGAKSLLAELADRLCFIDCDEEGIRIDVDTPQALAAARQRAVMRRIPSKPPTGDGPAR